MDVTERQVYQILIPYSPDSHPPQTKYKGQMPSGEILAWLSAQELNYWAMGFPLYQNGFMQSYYRGDIQGFMGSGFNFRDRRTAIAFAITWGGIWLTDRPEPLTR